MFYRIRSYDVLLARPPRTRFQLLFVTVKLEPESLRCERSWFSASCSARVWSALSYLEYTRRNSKVPRTADRIEAIRIPVLA